MPMDTLQMLRTGALKSDLPERYGTVQSRFHRWPAVDLGEQVLQSREIVPVIANREDELGDQAYDRDRDGGRSAIEHTINWLMHHLRIASRDGKRGSRYPAMVTIAWILEG